MKSLLLAVNALDRTERLLLFASTALASVALMAVQGCDYKPTSDQIQSVQQEAILAEGTAQVGMPACR